MSRSLTADQDEPGAESVLQMRRALGRQLAAMRNRAGLSQWDLAPLTGYSRSSLSDAELGRHRLRREFWLRCDGLLQGDGRLLASYDRIETAGAVLQQQAGRTTPQTGDRQTRDQRSGDQRSRGRRVPARLRAVYPALEQDLAAPGPAQPLDQSLAQPLTQPSGPQPAARPEPHRGSRVAMEACPHCRRPIAVLIVPSAPA